MTTVFTYGKGDLPLLISIPHDGRELSAGLLSRMTHAGRELADTDWHVKQLYDFATGFGASIIAAQFSRYVVDLNRAADDSALYDGQLSTGLFPSKTFAGEEIYQSIGALSEAERAERVACFWQPYHDKIKAALADIKQRFGYALLWDAHSIASEVPKLFRGVLPDLNIGTYDGASCHTTLANAVVRQAYTSPYSVVSNDRFRGGYITRHYGRPAQHVHAIQLELSQRNYMDEKNMRYDAELAGQLVATIEPMLGAFVSAAKRLYAASGNSASIDR